MTRPLSLVWLSVALRRSLLSFDACNSGAVRRMLAHFCCKVRDGDNRRSRRSRATGCVCRQGRGGRDTACPMQVAHGHKRPTRARLCQLQCISVMIRALGGEWIVHQPRNFKHCRAEPQPQEADSANDPSTAVERERAKKGNIRRKNNYDVGCLARRLDAAGSDRREV